MGLVPINLSQRPEYQLVIKAANPVIQRVGPKQFLAGSGDSALLLSRSGFAAYRTANARTTSLPASYLESAGWLAGPRPASGALIACSAHCDLPDERPRNPG